MDAEGTYLCMVTKLDSAARGTENYVEMQDAFLRIKDAKVRRRVVDLVAAIAGDDEPQA